MAKELTLKRATVKSKEEEKEPKQPAITAGTIDKLVDLGFNPSREKIREVTIIDRLQGRLLPILDLVNTGQPYILEIALYRQSPEQYEKEFEKSMPIPPIYLEELIYRIAQWQKSVGGANLTKMQDVILAQTEASMEEEQGVGGDPFKD